MRALPLHAPGWARRAIVVALPALIGAAPPAGDGPPAGTSRTSRLEVTEAFSPSPPFDADPAPEPGPGDMTGDMTADMAAGPPADVALSPGTVEETVAGAASLALVPPTPPAPVSETRAAPTASGAAPASVVSPPSTSSATTTVVTAPSPGSSPARSATVSPSPESASAGPAALPSELPRATTTTTTTVAPARRRAVRSANVEAEVVTLTNADRGGEGLGPLTRSACLDSVASGYAEEMARTGIMAHNAGAGAAVNGCVANATWGDNVGTNAPCSATALEQRWMASPPHRHNILAGAFQRIGVGAWADSSGACWVQVLFSS